MTFSDNNAAAHADLARWQASYRRRERRLLAILVAFVVAALAGCIAAASKRVDVGPFIGACVVLGAIYFL